MTNDPAALYTALVSDGRLSRLRRLTYRCAPYRCLLLDAAETPLGVLLHQKRYKYSEGENLRRSNDAGRSKQTFDGVNHWMPRTYYVEQSALGYPDDEPSPRLEITCDHVLAYPLEARVFHRDWDAGHAEIRVRPDYSRYAVD